MSEPKVYKVGSRHGDVMITGREEKPGGARSIIFFQCARCHTAGHDLAVTFTECAAHAKKNGYTFACRQCLHAAGLRKILHMNRRADYTDPDRVPSRFRCQHCCDLAWRDCRVCGRRAVPEPLQRATGYERTSESEGGFRR